MVTVLVVYRLGNNLPRCLCPSVGREKDRGKEEPLKEGRQERHFQGSHRLPRVVVPAPQYPPAQNCRYRYLLLSRYVPWNRVICTLALETPKRFKAYLHVD